MVIDGLLGGNDLLLDVKENTKMGGGLQFMFFIAMRQTECINKIRIGNDRTLHGPKFHNLLPT